MLARGPFRVDVFRASHHRGVNFRRDLVPVVLLPPSVRKLHEHTASMDADFRCILVNNIRAGAA